MQLEPYVETVRDGVTHAAALADDHTREVAHRLGDALESATRLALIRALSDATAGISADLAPTSVELTMSGVDPVFVVRVPPVAPEPTLLLPTPPPPPPAPEAPPEAEEEETARISLRLPASVKARVDEMADRDQISTNAWLQRAITNALADAGDQTREERRRGPGSESLRGLLGAIGPFGPDGPFGPHGVFGPHGPFGGDADRREPARSGEHRRGSVQGWVR